MKKRYWILVGFLLVTLMLYAENDSQIDVLTSLFSKALPEGFELDDSGMDKENVYVVFKKGAQEIIAVNWQKDYQIEFDDVDSFEHQGRKMIFYYAGFKKNGGLVVFLQNDAGYLVLGHTKPYMGEAIVKKEELISIIEKIDFGKIEKD